ncbi:MAG: alpha/beta hydrolase [Candidatus Omnitrophota bacterium]|jgi:hypothetical protein
MMIRFIVYTAIVIVVLLGFVKYLENRSVYFPDRNVRFTPDVVGMKYKDVTLLTKDHVKLSGWYIPNDGSTQRDILFCHGNAGNISDRLDKIKILHDLNVGVFIFDYRGYGSSQGSPSEGGIYRDAEAAYEYLEAAWGKREDGIILYGESLGSVAVLHLASKRHPAGVIVEGAFSNAVDMAKIIYPKLPSFLFRGRFDSLRKARTVFCPALFLHSKNDEVVPVSLARKLFDAYSAAKTFVELSGGHNESFLESKETYVNALTDFIKAFPRFYF